MTKANRSTVALWAFFLSACVSTGSTRQGDAASDADSPDGAELADAGTSEEWQDADAEDAEAEDASGDADAGTSDPVACTNGVTSQCIFDIPPSHGEERFASTYAVYEDYLYWVDHGDYIFAAPPANDYAIVRTRIGVWEREEVVGGLDFYAGEAFPCVHLSALRDYVLWSRCAEGTDRSPRYVQLSESGRTIHAVSGMGTLEHCAFDDSNAYCVASDGVGKLDLVREEWTLISETGGSDDAYLSIFYVEDTLY